MYKYIPYSAYYEVFRILVNCLAYGNSCANPIIYNYVSVEFKKGFREIFQCNNNRLTSGTSRPNKHTAEVVRGATKAEMKTMISNVSMEE